MTERRGWPKGRRLLKRWVLAALLVLIAVPAATLIWNQYRIKWWIEEVRLTEGPIVELHRRTVFRKEGELARQGWGPMRDRISFTFDGRKYGLTIQDAYARYLDRCADGYCLLAEQSGGYACFVLTANSSRRVSCRDFPVANVKPNILLPSTPGAEFASELRFPEKQWLLDREREVWRIRGPWPVPELMAKQVTWRE